MTLSEELQDVSVGIRDASKDFMDILGCFNWFQQDFRGIQLRIFKGFPWGFQMLLYEFQ